MNEWDKSRIRDIDQQIERLKAERRDIVLASLEILTKYDPWFFHDYHSKLASRLERRCGQIAGCKDERAKRRLEVRDNREERIANAVWRRMARA